MSAEHGDHGKAPPASSNGGGGFFEWLKNFGEGCLKVFTGVGGLVAGILRGAKPR